MKRWNPKKRKYEEYKIPRCWHTPLYSENIDEIVNCARCGSQLSYGKCYTSKQIHNEFGLGYPVCEKCYENEVREEMEGETE